jgi:beta-lactamase regulating signal transducer with metallopeptidase domain
MISEILIDLLKANLAAGAAILVVLAIRGLMRPRFGAQASYLLWFAPLAAGLAVLAPHPAARTVIAPIAQSAALAVDAFVAAAPAAARAGPDVAIVLFGLWLAGALAAAILLLRRQSAFVAAMGRLEPVDGSGVFRAEHVGVGPAVVGVLRPRIVAPADFESRFGAEERELILAHERVHLRQGDAAVNALACAVQCLCWFNPLVHLGARLLRIDQELACDASVIGRFPAARRIYAELLLKTQLAAQPLPLGCHWPAGSAHPLKARIAMLKSPLPAAAMRGMGLAVVGCLTLGAGTLAWSAQPGAALSGAALAGPGAAERAAAEAQGRIHPEYTCDPAAEARMEGCKVVRTSMWLAMPTRDDILRAYPPAALKAGAAAEVKIRCTISASGILSACEPVETAMTAPDGVALGEDAKAAFGQAAVTLSRYYQARLPSTPKMHNGHGTIRVVFSPTEREEVFGREPAKALPSPPPQEHRPQAQAAAVRIPVSFAPAPAPPPVIVKPDWVTKPVAADVVRFYPAEAVKQHFEGATSLSCGVNKDGRLTNCVATGITTFGVPDAIREDFRKATLELAGLFQMRPQTVDGVPTGDGRINIPIRWSLPTDPEAAARLNALHDPGPKT